GGELVVSLVDRLLTLAELEDSAVGTRRPPGGDAVVVRGRAAGVFVEAEFFAGGVAAAPTATVTVTVFPDRLLPSVKGVGFFRLPEASLGGGTGPPVALVSGYHSLEPCRVVALGAPEAAEQVSYGALGLTRGGRGFALAFDAGGPGEGRVRLAQGELEAVSEWSPTRPLRPEGDLARLRLGFDPQGDGLTALNALFVPSSLVDQERLAQAVAPAGWCSRQELGAGVTEGDVVANTAVCAAHFDRRFFRYIELGDGYQRAAGVWDTNERFPHGHAWLTDRIHAAGFKAALWVAPFAVSEGSGIPTEHPDWLLRDASGPVVCDTRPAWGGVVYAMDGAHPQVQQWLAQLARRVVRDWGYDALRVDALHWATLGREHYGGLTHAEAYRSGLGALRDGLGTEAFLVASAAPLQHAVGLVNGMQVAPVVSASWGGVEVAARAMALRSCYHRSTWVNDPGCVVARAPLTRPEAEAWASLVALGGGITLLADNLPELPAERLTLLARILPVAPVAGRPIDATGAEPVAAPAIAARGTVFPITGPWRFRTGDDAAYGTKDFDEQAWETIPVPAWWREAGHRGYGGVAWYRTRFVLPPGTPRPPGAASEGAAALELGKIAEADETFVNGVRVGQTGDFPPHERAEPQVYRRYRVPPESLNWGGENVLAVRVYGTAESGGGLWSVRRDTPPRTWVAEGAPRWW
ncbi:MAG TPA: alpha-galactosidase, partial [Gemmatimonadales bacterium]|nr:alpha-galactosidase [Gemmatimonadales bacterium]